MALALALGVAGGAVFRYVNMPLAWMLGAMAATMAASLAGVPLGISPRLRAVMISVLGVMLGSAFAPGLFERIDAWFPAIVGLLVYIVLTGAVTFTYLRRLGGYGTVTAYFTAMPGGLTEMVLAGAAMGGDDRRIALNHAWRVTLVVFTVPVWFRFVEGYAPTAAAVGASAAQTGPIDLAILAACAVVGAFAARLVRLPAATLTGPMLLSAAAHLSGLTQSTPPVELVSAAQVVIGAALGCRFAGVKLRHISEAVILGTGLTVLMLGLTVLCSLVVHALTGIETRALILAYAPGGLAEMSLIALALGTDVPFVAAHHILRVLLVIVLAPLFFKLLPGRAADRPKSGAD